MWRELAVRFTIVLVPPGFSNARGIRDEKSEKKKEVNVYFFIQSQ